MANQEHRAPPELDEELFDFDELLRDATAAVEELDASLMPPGDAPTPPEGRSTS